MEDRNQRAVTHLAMARSQKRRNRHFGSYEGSYKVRKTKRRDTRSIFTKEFRKYQRKHKIRKKEAALSQSSFLYIKDKLTENACGRNFFETELENRGMKKGNHIVSKIVLLLILILALGIYLFARTRNSSVTDTYSEKKVGIQEVIQELSFGIYEEEDWATYFGESDKAYLTSKQLEQLLVRLDLSEYIEVPGMTGYHEVTREEWNLIYDQILEILDMEQSVQKQKLLVMDSMQAKESNVLITNQGDYYTSLPVSYFEKWKGYELYCIEDRCIGIVGLDASEMYVSNAYLIEHADGLVSFLYDGASYVKEVGEMENAVNAGVCDLVFSEGNIVSLRMKQDVIIGALLSYNESIIEIDGYGQISHSGDVPVYQTYGEVVEKSLSDVILGNMEVEYVTGENQVCAILIHQPANIENIRVLLLAENGTNYRNEVYLTCDTAATMKCGEWEQEVEAASVIPASEFLAAKPEDTLTLTPLKEEGRISICDASGKVLSNGYAGTIEVRGREEGYTVVNEVLLETYLCAVVPSEMPSTYAPEALKAQAVCARSYAYNQLLRADLAEYGAHINDSTSYQVYNNIPPTEAATQAVQATAGQILAYQGKPVEAYYFSTSMGYTGTAEVWDVDDVSVYGYLKKTCLDMTGQNLDLSNESDFLAYIQSMPQGYDSDIKYFRWVASADYSDKTDTINEILLNRRSISEKNITFYQGNSESPMEKVDGATVHQLGDITKISVLERSESGSILTLQLTYERGRAEVKTEYNIRKVLGAGITNVVYADSSETNVCVMLPSAFCSVTAIADGTYTLQGGGYGHGLGMSQNGANGMAKSGMNYEDILQYFYNDITLTTME